MEKNGKEAPVGANAKAIVDELVTLTHQVRRGGRGNDARAKGLGGANGFVLRQLFENGEASPSDLRDALDVTTPRVTAILNDLEDRGLISRSADEKDRRRVAVTLTAKGRAMVKEQVASAYEEISELVEQIGLEDAQALVRILRTISEAGGTLPF